MKFKNSLSLSVFFIVFEALSIRTSAPVNDESQTVLCVLVLRIVCAFNTALAHKNSFLECV